MPFYAWQGIGLDGQVRQGRLFATSELELEQLLLQREIGLMQCADLKLSDLSRLRTPKAKFRLLFFRELAVLLAAGIQLPQALNFLADQVSDNRLQLIVLALAHAVQQGQKLSQALAQFPACFPPLICQLVRAGETAHDLTQAITQLAGYLEKQAELRGQLRLALLMPIITLGVFMAVTLFIFVVIMPTFATIFTAAGQPLHSATKLVLQISATLRSIQLLWLILGLAGAIWLLRWWGTTLTGRQLWDCAWLKVPGMNRLISALALCNFWQTVHLLVRGNTPLPAAWQQATAVINNTVLQAQLQELAGGLKQGISLAQLAQRAGKLFMPEVVVMLGAGMESGQLVAMTGRIVPLYEQRVQQLLKLILNGLQPVLVISLGLLIALLIFAVYLPLFELPNLVRF